MGRKARKVKATKKTKPFNYGAKQNPAYYSFLNFVQQQAHSQQVNSLLHDLAQSQAYAKRAVKDALAAVYDNSGPMDIDRQVPDPPDTVMRRAPALARAKATPDTVMRQVKPKGKGSVKAKVKAIEEAGPSKPVESKGKGKADTAEEARLDRVFAAAHETPVPAPASAQAPAPPAAAPGRRFEAKGPAQLSMMRSRDDIPTLSAVRYKHKVGFNERMNDLRAMAPSSSIPEKAAITERLTEISKEDATKAHFLKISRSNLGNEFRPANRDIKSAKIIPGKYGGIGQSTGFREYFNQRDDRIRAEHHTDPLIGPTNHPRTVSRKIPFDFVFKAEGESARTKVGKIQAEDGGYFNRRMRILRDDNPSSSVPTTEETAAYKTVKLQMHTEDAARLSTFPKINRQDTAYEFKPANRDLKAPRIIPGIENGEAQGKGYGSYFSERMGELVH